jgi:hypothetical protein
VEHEADAAFRRVRWVHVGLIGVTLYLTLAWPWVQEPDAALPGARVWLWPLRLVLGVLSVAGLMAVWRVSRALRGRGSRTTWLARIAPAGEPAASIALLGMAFCEAIAVYGLLLFIVGGERSDSWAFGAVSLVGLVWHFPTRRRWARDLEPKG